MTRQRWKEAVPGLCACSFFIALHSTSKEDANNRILFNSLYCRSASSFFQGTLSAQGDHWTREHSRHQDTLDTLVSSPQRSCCSRRSAVLHKGLVAGSATLWSPAFLLPFLARLMADLTLLEKKVKTGQAWWCIIPVVPSTQEPEAKRLNLGVEDHYGPGQ
ncbi:uncharacterized protein LOC143444032 [Arvicanthis niloticus]|uniref:uncharacterized protein LOC143314302 n=1 Tax=Arvicanthis niloticus TaxID=61156 RepID=UPI00402BA8A8